MLKDFSFGIFGSPLPAEPWLVDLTISGIKLWAGKDTQVPFYSSLNHALACCKTKYLLIQPAGHLVFGVNFFDEITKKLEDTMRVYCDPSTVAVNVDKWNENGCELDDGPFYLSDLLKKYSFNFASQTKDQLNERLLLARNLQRQFNKIVFFHETDTIDIPEDREANTLITIASGLRVLRYLDKLPNVRQVIIYDTSDCALEFQRQLRQHGDKVPYQHLVDNFLGRRPNAIEVQPSFGNDYGELFKRFEIEIQTSGLIEKWRQIPTDFIQADLITEYKDIARLIEADHPHVVFDISNIYVWPMNYVERTQTNINHAFSALQKVLSGNSTCYRIVGTDPNWNELN